MPARAATEKVVSITTLIVVSAPLGLVAALSSIVFSCHLGGAGLVPRRFKLLFRVLVTKDRSVLTSFFGSWLRCHFVSHSSICRTYFAALVDPNATLL